MARVTLISSPGSLTLFRVLASRTPSLATAAGPASSRKSCFGRGPGRLLGLPVRVPVFGAVLAGHSSDPVRPARVGSSPGGPCVVCAWTLAAAPGQSLRSCLGDLPPGPGARLFGPLSWVLPLGVPARLRLDPGGGVRAVPSELSRRPPPGARRAPILAAGVGAPVTSLFSGSVPPGLKVEGFPLV